MHAAIDVNAKAYAAVKLDRNFAVVLSLGGLFVMNATACSFSIVSCLALLVEQQEAQPDAKTC